MAKVYVVQEIGYEFDDSNFYQPECGGGTPVKGFLNRENADKEKERLNKKARKERRYEGIGDYYEVVEVDLDVLSHVEEQSSNLSESSASDDDEEYDEGNYDERDNDGDYEEEDNEDMEDEDEPEYVDDDPRPELVDPPGTITNSIGMKLVPIPAGSFMMGSPKKEKDRDDNEQQHKVTLTKNFYLGMTQVTQAQYEKVMRKNLSNFQGDEVSGRDSSEFPVEEVSWDDAVKFCKKLSSLPEEKKAGRVYRLPTEAEWEYACRAGSTTAFSFGKSSKSLGDYGWYDDNSGNRPHPVALKKPNAWGLYDMHGNVWEWCSDWCDDYPKDAVSDPTGPEEGSSRVSRGGSWSDEAAFCRSAFRDRFPPGIGSSNLGFRVALVQVATAELKSSTGAGGRE